VDLVVCGSVAVNREGARIGKGGGFSDLEVAFLLEAGAIRPDTVLATTVHALQVVDEPLPETIYDFRVDLIVTPGPDHLVRRAASATRNPLGASAAGQDRRSPSVGGPGSPALSHQSNRLNGPPVQGAVPKPPPPRPHGAPLHVEWQLRPAASGVPAPHWRPRPIPTPVDVYANDDRHHRRACSRYTLKGVPSPGGNVSRSDWPRPQKGDSERHASMGRTVSGQENWGLGMDRDPRILMR
jgi:hypothetical protein